MRLVRINLSWKGSRTLTLIGIGWCPCKQHTQIGSTLMENHIAKYVLYILVLIYILMNFAKRVMFLSLCYSQRKHIPKKLLTV